MQGQQPATGSRTPENSNKLCRLTNSTEGRPPGAQNKSRLVQATNSISELKRYLEQDIDAFSPPSVIPPRPDF